MKELKLKRKKIYLKNENDLLMVTCKELFLCEWQDIFFMYEYIFESPLVSVVTKSWKFSLSNISSNFMAILNFLRIAKTCRTKGAQSASFSLCPEIELQQAKC